MTVDYTVGQGQRSSQNASGYVSNNHSASQPVCFHLSHFGNLQTAVIYLEIVGILEKVAGACQNSTQTDISPHKMFSQKSFSFPFLKTDLFVSYSLGSKIKEYKNL